jgi:hypothetical protein
MDLARRKSRVLDAVYPVLEPKSAEPLQACDLVAWEQRDIVKRRLSGDARDPREVCRRLLVIDNDLGISSVAGLRRWAVDLDVPRHYDAARARPFAAAQPTGEASQPLTEVGGGQERRRRGPEPEFE